MSSCWNFCWPVRPKVLWVKIKCLLSKQTHLPTGFSPTPAVCLILHQTVQRIQENRRHGLYYKEFRLYWERKGYQSSGGGGVGNRTCLYRTGQSSETTLQVMAVTPRKTGFMQGGGGREPIACANCVRKGQASVTKQQLLWFSYTINLMPTTRLQKEGHDPTKNG